ncbi:MAG: UDP-glucose 4-epimerase [Chloroflexi bacterium HGW-Chloroflexi-10]|nr:MAG: UDP-glucose 4-epimerase [Chloroflexi bacterium HGW-Chloroflexi-10]
MKILVTGGAGFIASHVVDAYIKNGHQVIIVDSLITGRKSNLNPKATFYEIDIRSPELEMVFEKEKPEIVNHHAAQMDVRKSVADPKYDADINVVGSLNLLELARKHGVKRVIYSSSGGTVYGEPEYLPCDEKHPIMPICPYGATKYIFEVYLQMYKFMYGMDYTVFRYPNVYGPRQDPHGEAGVVAIFTGQMCKNQPVIINGDGKQQRDYVYVGDVATANLLAVEKQKDSNIFNLGSSVPTDVNQIFETLQKIIGYPFPASHGPAKLGETRRIYLSARHIHDELGWSPSVSLEEGLRATVEFFLTKEAVV